MKVNRDNYPAFFLDHFEGRLSEDEQGELMRFLEAHPDLKAEFDDFELITLPGMAPVSYPDKQQLKKGSDHYQEGCHLTKPGVPSGKAISRSNHEEWLVAFVEGDLTDVQQQEVKGFMADHPEYNRELALMKASRLIPDQTIRFPGKSSLRRHTIGVAGRPLFKTLSAVAAVLLLAVTIYTFFPLQNKLQLVQEQPADEDRVYPEAVAETPVPGQAVPAAMDPQPVQPLLQDEPVIQLATDTGREESAVFLPRISPGEDIRLAAIPAAGLQLDGRDVSAGMGQRKEYLWLAYRDDDFMAEEAREDAPSGEGPGFVRLALNQLQEDVGTGFQRFEEAVEEERQYFRELAGRGLASLSRLPGNPVSVHEQPDEGVRRRHISLGGYIEISRTSAADDQ